jgi:hypothetical protein
MIIICSSLKTDEGVVSSISAVGLHEKKKELQPLQARKKKRLKDYGYIVPTVKRYIPQMILQLRISFVTDVITTSELVLKSIFTSFLTKVNTLSWTKI